MSEHDIEVHHSVRIGNPNGPELAGDLYLPADGRPGPTLLTLHPYRNDLHAGLEMEPALRWFAAHGYACLMVNCGGTGASDDASRGFGDRADVDDARAAIAWITAQDWSDGSVGMWGYSYAGLTALQAARVAPAGLKAIIAIHTPLYPRVSMGAGTLRKDYTAFVRWGIHMYLEQLIPPMDRYPGIAEQHRWQRRLQQDPMVLDIAARSVAPEAWQDRDVDASSVAVPTWCVGGWRDPLVADVGTMFSALSTPRRLLIGPWTHELPWQSSNDPIDFLPMALGWWDRWLRGKETASEPPVTIHIGGERPGWAHLDQWPPSVELRTFATDGSTELVDGPGSGSPTPIAEYVSAPEHGARSGWNAEHGSDQRDDDARAMTFTTAPLAAPMLIGGRPAVTVTTDPLGGHPARLVVQLTTVDPEGRSVFVTSGVGQPDAAADSHRVELVPTAHRIPAGQRLRVVVSDADFPDLTPLQDPTPFAVTRVEAVLPAVTDLGVASADVLALPPPEGTGLAVGGTVMDSAGECAVAMTMDLPAMPMRGGHTLVTTADMRSSVRTTPPEATISRGRYTADLTMCTGERVEVTTEIRTTQALLVASGDVVVDGVPIFSKSWSVPIGSPHVDQPGDLEPEVQGEAFVAD
jgi:putative CocE/NonD family hydrolase